MQRPKLEVASWIAGVIGTTVALVALFIQLRQAPADAAAAPSTQAAASTAPPNPAIGATARPETALRAAFEAAKAQNSMLDRESSLMSVARSAIGRSEFELALDVASSLNIYANRDKLLIVVSCHLAYRSRFTEAREAAKRINSLMERGAALRRIASTAQIEPGKGENEYSCGEA